MAAGLGSAIRTFHQKLFKYAWKFGVVGGLGWIIDTGIFNLFVLTVLDGAGGELWSKVISVGIATVATWFGNRYWAFREHRRKNFWLEFVEFVITSVLGLGIQELCLWVSHYVLGYTSLWADNISANVIGVVLAMAFRFFMYRFIVFSPTRRDSQSRLDREAAERALDEAALLASIDPAAADFLEETAEAAIDSGAEPVAD